VKRIRAIHTFVASIPPYSLIKASWEGWTDLGPTRIRRDRDSYPRLHETNMQAVFWSQCVHVFP
jgi:hypothetical protein